MSFQEKSAWVMSLSLIFGGVSYFGAVAEKSAEIGQLAQPFLTLVALYTLVLIIIATVGHIVIAVLASRDANAPLDERERRIFERAGHASSYVFGAGVVFSLGIYLFIHSGDVLFYSVFASLMIGQLAEYAVRIFFYRVAV